MADSGLSFAIVFGVKTTRQSTYTTYCFVWRAYLLIRFVQSGGRGDAPPLVIRRSVGPRLIHICRAASLVSLASMIVVS
jgi:hypothetical protein